MWKDPACAPNRRQLYLFYWSSRAGAARFWRVTFLEWPPPREPQFPKFCLHQCVGGAPRQVWLAHQLILLSPLQRGRGETVEHSQKGFPERWKRSELGISQPLQREVGVTDRTRKQRRQSASLSYEASLPSSQFNFNLSLLERTDIISKFGKTLASESVLSTNPQIPPVVTLSNSYEDIGLFWGEMTQ